jgi:hypothetical protein
MSDQLTNDPIMQYFAYDHLPSKLQEVSKPFCDLAFQVQAGLPRNPERTVALRKLLEAKDAAVRAALAQPSYWAHQPPQKRTRREDDQSID